MQTPLEILLGSALAIGAFHTLIGVDHTLPFVVLARAQGWSLRKLWALTAVCGLGHVLASVALGAAGIAVGLAATDLAGIEGARGRLAAWGLIAFGLTYAAWSFARRRRRQRHAHRHADGLVHVHEHSRAAPHAHGSGGAAALTGWSLFAIFVLGPCEPLIPLLMVPALDLGPLAVALVALAFGAATLGTMLLAVTVGYAGLSLPLSRRLEAHAGVLAGLAVAGSGLAIQLFGS
jgi:nickel/cobalt exporter